jgi:hypothetical protein
MLTIDQLIEEYTNEICLNYRMEPYKLLEIDVDLNLLLNKNIYFHHTFKYLQNISLNINLSNIIHLTSMYNQMNYSQLVVA